MFFLPTILGAVGTGLEVAGGLFGAGSRRRTAQTNFELNQYNATIEREDSLAALALNKAQNQIAFESARFNAESAMIDAEAREKNAQRIRMFTQARTEAGRKALRRQRRQFEQFESKQRATVAASGVSMDGSVLDVLAESAGQMQMAMEDMADQVNMDRTQGNDQATLEEFGAAQDATAARASLRSATSGFKFGNLSTDIERNRIQQRYDANLFGAGIQRESQFEAANMQRFTAGAGIFTGATNYLQKRDREQYQGIR